MTVIDWLGAVSGIVSILAFIFAVWVWLKSDIKVRELQEVIQAAYDVTGTIMWEMQTIRVDDSAARLRSTERSFGEISALHTITGRYLRWAAAQSDSGPSELVERGVIWSMAMIWDVETSERTREIWFITPDLEPDLSDSTVGSVVADNIRRGKRYVYFCPKAIPNFETARRKLLANIGASKSTRIASRISIVPIDKEDNPSIFQRGSIIIFFSEDAEWETGRAFEEIVFTKLPKRGLFWQEYSPSEAERIKVGLKQRLDDWRTRALP